MGTCQPVPGSAMSARSPHAGESLIELLIAVMIMGVAATAVLGQVMMSASTSQMYRGVSDSLEYLQAWAEQVDAAPYQNCADGVGVTRPTPTGLTNPTITVEYWAGGGYVPREQIPGCQQPAAQRTDNGLQRWTLSVTAPGVGLPSTTQRMTLVKRNPCTVVVQAGCSA